MGQSKELKKKKHKNVIVSNSYRTKYSTTWVPDLKPPFPLSRLGLVHGERVALGTQDLIGQNLTKGIQSDQSFQTL